MTGMQLIIPPLDDRSDQDASDGEVEQHNNNNQSHTNGSDAGQDDAPYGLGGSDGTASSTGAAVANDPVPTGRGHRAMSRELQDNFRLMRSLWRKSRLGENGTDDEERRRKLALETALAVDSELSRMRNGIAELEALLGMPSEQQQQARVVMPPDAAIFPALPPIVPVEDEAGDEDDVRVESDEDSVGVEQAHRLDRDPNPTAIGGPSDA